VFNRIAKGFVICLAVFEAILLKPFLKREPMRYKTSNIVISSIRILLTNKFHSSYTHPFQKNSDLSITGINLSFPVLKGKISNNLKKGVLPLKNRADLKILFSPQSVAVIGASNQRNKWGYRIIDNLLTAGYSGSIFPINPKEKTICGLTAYTGLAEIPAPVDFAVICVPVAYVPAVFQDCIRKGVRAGFLITAGFGEDSDEGRLMERSLVETAAEGGMVFAGPNGNGLFSTAERFFPVMLPLFPPQGSISMVTQSGNIGASMLTRSIKYNIGFAKYVSSGNEAMIKTEDVIAYYGKDPETEVIFSYVEGIEDGRRFLDVCREVSLKKPIVLFKSGRTQGGASAARSHTGSLAGSDSVFDGACRQAGILRCTHLDQMFDLAVALQVQPLPPGPRIGIITSGGGWGVLAADACEQRGLTVEPLPKKTIQRMDTFMPPWWSKGNPIDLVAGTVDDRCRIFQSCIESLFETDAVDAVLLIGIGTILEHHRKDYEFDETEKRLIEAEIKIGDMIPAMMKRYGRPIFPATDLTLYSNPDQVPLFQKLQQQGILIYSDPDRAAAVMAGLYQRHQFLARFR
jgi:acetyltransferase